MHMYCNYAKEHWTLEGENPPVGLILCARTNAAVARYALDGLPNRVFAAEYHMVLPDEAVLAEELARTGRERAASGKHNGRVRLNSARQLVKPCDTPHETVAPRHPVALRPPCPG